VEVKQVLWTISKQFRFEAAHYLPDHDGKCAKLHGHSWVMHVAVQADQLYKTGPKRGMVMDFGEIKETVKPLVGEYLDHKCLNDSIPEIYPTSECLAQWVFRKVEGKLDHQRIVELVSVSIEETCTSSCTYSE
jgi:6-pyruvoyltetrahydropterin/6-carboxytetrahydropterin synthase